MCHATSFEGMERTVSGVEIKLFYRILPPICHRNRFARSD
jgi:hypothetical protein